MISANYASSNRPLIATRHNVNKPHWRLQQTAMQMNSIAHSPQAWKKSDAKEL